MRANPRPRFPFGAVRSVARTVALAVALAPFPSVTAGEGAVSGVPRGALAAQEREEAGGDGAAVPGPPLPDARFADARGDLDLALTGDAILTRPLSPHGEPAFLALREIIRGATAAFTNLEVLFHDYGKDVIPAAQSGGTYMRAEPELARELVWLGFDMVSRANNHTMDFGAGGMRATTRAVEAAGLVHAGAGENLALARSPAYLETPGGRVALVSVASTFADGMRAGPQRKDLRGRPGLAPLRYRTVYTVPRDRMAALRGAADSLGLGGWWRGPSEGDTLSMMGRTFVAGEGWGSETSADPGDLEALARAVEEGERQAAWVVVSSHSHEGADSREVPAEFVVEAAHAAIDAGADVFVAHGPHVLRGVEIYRGRPIFYSLANFIFQNETVLLQPAENYERYGLGPEALPGEFQDRRIDLMGDRSFPADDAYWESVLAVPSFRAGELAQVRLHPVTLGPGLPRPVRGRPMLAGREHGRRILERLRTLSEPYGTEIAIEGGTAVIRP